MRGPLKDTDAEPGKGPSLFRRLLTEQLEPGPAAAAVGLGLTVGIIPVYGLQSVVALGLASLFRLNRPLTFAATFINNPLLQPFLVIGSLQLGHFVIKGRWLELSFDSLKAAHPGDYLVALIVGSVLLSVIIGGTAAAVVYVALSLRGGPLEREWRHDVRERFRGAGWYARGFVRWKTRLDRIFGLLLAEDLGSGPVMDLGCGYGATLALAAFRDSRRALHGCDLDRDRLEAAGQALAGLDVHLSASDVRDCPLPEAGLILIIDVLQYLGPAEQAALLRRCVSSLRPGGRLIFRLPDRTRGLTGLTTRALDRLILIFGGWRTTPVYLAPEQYVDLLTEAGLEVQVRSHRNRLPLRHLLFSAARPEARQ